MCVFTGCCLYGLRVIVLFRSVADHFFFFKGTVDEALEFAGTDGVLEFADGLGFDLPDTLAGDFEDPADLFERVSVAVTDARSGA